jgi:hypothetical protein
MTRALWLLAILLCSIAVGRALAASSNDGLVHACAAPQSAGDPGRISLAASDGSCPAGESALAWETHGPTGPTGQQGPQGEVGPTGTTGPQGYPGQNATGWLSGLGEVNRTQLVGAPAGLDMTCPAGTHMYRGAYDWLTYDLRTWTTNHTLTVPFWIAHYNTYFIWDYPVLSNYPNPQNPDQAWHAGATKLGFEANRKNGDFDPHPDWFEGFAMCWREVQR